MLDPFCLKLETHRLSYQEKDPVAVVNKEGHAGRSNDPSPLISLKKVQL